MEEIRDTTLNMTLGEIRKRDIDNLTLIYKASKKYVFDSNRVAWAFINKALSRAVLKFGIDTKKIEKEHPLSSIEEIRKQCAEKQVTLEKLRIRKKDTWRSGLYMYFRNEIAYFISIPQPIPWNDSKNPHIIIPRKGQYKYMIVTNVM